MIEGCPTLTSFFDESEGREKMREHKNGPVTELVFCYELRNGSFDDLQRVRWKGPHLLHTNEEEQFAPAVGEFAVAAREGKSTVHDGYCSS